MGYLIVVSFCHSFKMNRDLALRFPENPLISPHQLSPSCKMMTVVSVVNPGVFHFEGKLVLLVCVTERPISKEGFISFPVFSPHQKTRFSEPIHRKKPFDRPISIVEISVQDPLLRGIDSKIVKYNGRDYLTTFSYLRLLWSDDGINFNEREGFPFLYGKGELESFGIKNGRVTFLDDRYLVSYTTASENGVGVGLRSTKDWMNFEYHHMILAPPTTDCALFSEKIKGCFYALHRPKSVEFGGSYIWLAKSLDGVYWGNHQMLLKTRPNHWDNASVGAGTAPIRTKHGWLEIYYGANKRQQVGLGAFLIDLKNPAKVLARTDKPIMIAKEAYEKNGELNQGVFTGGRVVNGDELILYYGAANKTVCAAKFSIAEILSSLIYF